MASAHRWVGLVALVAALAACSESDGTGNPPATAPRSAAAGLGDAPGSKPPAPAPSPRLVTEANFLAPSGNIGCYLDTKSARCDIVKRSWKPPPAPADCELDWASGALVDGAGKAAFTCAGDTVLGAKTKLAYGQALRAGDFQCSSDRRWIRCENLQSGHGFILSVGRYELF
jgi:hypothetical protein